MYHGDVKKVGFMWAPDAAYENGTYYFYFPHPTGSGDAWNNTWRIGIAKSNSPASGFKCADGGYDKEKRRFTLCYRY